MLHAPVCITTICRAEKFFKCIESLRRCTGAEDTELFIGVDYPVKQDHWDGYKKICEYLPAISGFRAVHILKHDENLGQRKNVIALQELIRKDYDCYILTEDDNEFSPNFLEYMNQCLEKYRNDSRVVRICGFSYESWENLKGYPSNAFPMQGYCAWGVGTWFNKRDEYANACFPKINDIINNPTLVRILFKKKMHVSIHQMMFRTKFKISGSDVRFRCYCAINDKYCIFPAVSKVRNLGFDGESTNCVTINTYAKQKIDDSPSFKLDDFEIKHYKQIDDLHDRHYGGKFLSKLLVRFEYWRWKRTGTVMRDNKFINRIMKFRIKYVLNK